jgi:predicted  nucleic acid-binding Zn-ribbon protein
MQDMETVEIHCRDCGAFGSAAGDGVEELLRRCPSCGGKTVRSYDQLPIQDWRPDLFRDFRVMRWRNN